MGTAHPRGASSVTNCNTSTCSMCMSMSCDCVSPSDTPSTHAMPIDSREREHSCIPLILTFCSEALFRVHRSRCSLALRLRHCLVATVRHFQTQQHWKTHIVTFTGKQANNQSKSGQTRITAQETHDANTQAKEQANAMQKRKQRPLLKPML